MRRAGAVVMALGVNLRALKEVEWLLAHTTRPDPVGEALWWPGGAPRGSRLRGGSSVAGRCARGKLCVYHMDSYMLWPRSEVHHSHGLELVTCPTQPLGARKCSHGQTTRALPWGLTASEGQRRTPRL